jgi:hypothetical protein
VDGQRTSDASEGLNPKRLEEVLKRDLNVWFLNPCVC